MKREDIKIVFDNIEPDMSAKERMLENVLNHSKNKKENAMLPFNFRKAIPALVLAVVFAGGILAYGLKGIFFNHGPRNDGSPQTADMIGEDAASGREDMAAPMLNQFQIDDRQYILTSDYVQEFGFPAVIDDKDIGQKIATIEKSPDKSLIGCEVFRYIPAGSEAVVAVKRNNEYVLFRFFTFESYINNQDEDAIEYLKLYGIEGPEDISKIRFIVYDEKSKLEGYTNVRGEITDRNEIANFYNFYSVLKNSSDKYFEKLFGYNGAGYSRDVEIDSAYPADMPAVGSDTPVSAIIDRGEGDVSAASGGIAGIGETGAGAVAPSQGSAGNALAYPVAIRIYNQNGVYYESMYYRNISFISRYEITAEFAAFIESYIK